MHILSFAVAVIAPVACAPSWVLADSEIDIEASKTVIEPSSGDVIELNSGARITGTIVKRNDQKIWIDVGAGILEFRVDDVANVIVSEADVVADTDSVDLFYTATNLPELPPKEQAKRIGAAVIKVSTPKALGSGVIINPQGFAITNAHVIQGETTLRATVWFPEQGGTLRREVIEDVEIIAVNSAVDLALIKIPHPTGGEFPYAPMEMGDVLDVGQTVFAIGNPLGLERTMSQGVVSTKSRSFEGLTYIQTDTPINPGNSGGPLFNTKGEVVGITNMGIMFGESLNFAIPARYVRDFVRNREAFSFDKTNPNSGHQYHQPPERLKFGTAPQLRDRSSEEE